MSMGQDLYIKQHTKHDLYCWSSVADTCQPTVCIFGWRWRRGTWVNDSHTMMIFAEKGMLSALINIKMNIVPWMVWFYMLVQKWCWQYGVLFFATWITLHLACTISLPVCKNHTIRGTTFVLALNDAKTILFPRISSLYLYHLQHFENSAFARVFVAFSWIVCLCIIGKTLLLTHQWCGSRSSGRQRKSNQCYPKH